MKFQIDWIDHGREAENPPDARYPTGIDLDASKGAAQSCIASLPYPAPRCGVHHVECMECGYKAAITAAGRVDDPRTVKLPCKLVSGVTLKMDSGRGSMDFLAPGASAAPIKDPIPDVPVVQGAKGRAWLCDWKTEGLRQQNIPRDMDATLDHWLVEAPWAHSAWHSYSIVLIHLRPLADGSVAELIFPHATHQLWIWVIDPTKDRRALLANGTPQGHWLSPVNFSAQFTEITDDLARERVRNDVQKICDGKLSPDTDFISDWIKLYNNSMIKKEFRR